MCYLFLQLWGVPRSPQFCIRTLIHRTSCAPDRVVMVCPSAEAIYACRGEEVIGHPFLLTVSTAARGCHRITIMFGNNTIFLTAVAPGYLV